jgi:hypothetical protein
MPNATFGEELQMLYMQMLEDIRTWKAQQWHVTASSISLHVALAGVLSLLRFFNSNVSCGEKWVISILAWLVAGFGVTVIIMLHKSTCNARQRVVRILDTIPDGGENSLRSFFTGTDPQNYSKCSYGVAVPMLLACHMVLAASVLTWLVYLA